MRMGLRWMAAAAILLPVLACGPDEVTLLRTFSAEWSAQDAPGGMRMRLGPGSGILVGLDVDGSVLDTMHVDVVEVDSDSRTVYLRRTETDVEFFVEALEPAEDGRSRIRLRFPDGRNLRLTFERPLSGGE